MKGTCDKAGNVMVSAVEAGAVNVTVPDGGATCAAVGGGCEASVTQTRGGGVSHVPQGDGGVEAPQAIGASWITTYIRGLRNGRCSRGGVRGPVWQQEPMHEKPVGGSAEVLRENICKLLGGGDKLRYINSASNAITELIGVAENVLCVFEGDGIEGEIDGGFVVQVKRGGCGDSEADVFKEVPDKQGFAAGEGGGKDLGFCRRGGDGLLAA